MPRQCHSQCKDGSAGLAGWLADWLFSNDKICMSLPNGVWWHDSRRRGEKKGKKREKSHHCWNGRVDSVGWQSWQTKSTLSFHQCNFWLLCDRPPACQAESIGSWGEGWKKKKKLWWQKQVAGVCVQCLYSKTHSTDGSGNKVRVLRALIKKKKEKKPPDWCNKSCRWRINTFMRQWDEKKWILVFVFQRWQDEKRLEWNSTAKGFSTFI